MKGLLRTTEVIMKNSVRMYIQFKAKLSEKFAIKKGDTLCITLKKK